LEGSILRTLAATHSNALEILLRQTQTWPQKARGHGIGGWRRRGRRQRLAWTAQDRTFALLGGWLIIVFLLGGGSRADIQSLMLLRPAAVLVLAYAIAGLRREHIAEHRVLLGLAAAWLGLHLFQIVPLPPELWRALPGRSIIAEIDRDTGLGDVWRPLTMVPPATRNAIWAMLPPVAVLLLGIQLDSARRERLLPLLLGLGLISALIGALQLLGDPQGGLYFYRITNNGSAVGLFANRNHQAIFLATLPAMLLVWAALRSGKMPMRADRSRLHWAVAAGGILIVTPLILVTGSRAGLVTSLVCLLAVPAMLATWSLAAPAGGQSPPARAWLRPAALLLLAIAGLAMLTVVLGRGLAFDRLVGTDGSDARVRILGTVLAMIRLYWPLGTGFGSFTDVFQVHEPRELLAPVYMNHAHNDWLELALSGGLPAVALAAAAVVVFAVAAGRLLRPDCEDRDEVLMGRLGLLIILMLALASLGDYPLRVPSLASLAVVAALWAAPSTSRRQAGQ
jgi:O-antigen ligase